MAVAWTFLFPLFLMAALGGLFSGGSPPFAAIALRDHDHGPLAQAIRTRVESQGWHAGDSVAPDAAILIPPGASDRARVGAPVRLPVTYATPNPQKRAAIRGFLGSVLLEVNASLEAARVPVQLDYPSAPVAGASVPASTYADFLLFGLVGLNVLSTALFGVGVGSSWFRERGVLRRLWLTPAAPRDFLGAQLVHIASLLAASTALLVGFGHLFFATPWPRLGAFLTVMAFGSFALIPIGLAIAARTARPQTTQMCANLIYFPLMLLSGVYFRPERMATNLSTALDWLPLKPFLDALRAASDGTPIAALAPELATLAAYGVAGCALARGVFRWNG